MKAQVKKFLLESKLAIAMTIMIGARCVDRVLYTRMTYDYSQFLWYLSNVILPIAFLVTSWPVVWYKMLFTNDITPEMRAFPSHKFAIMACFDMLFNLLSAFPTPHIGGNLVNVLNQVTLPFNMVLSYFFLTTTYRRCHILGALLVLYGGMVDMIPILSGSATSNTPDATFGWVLLYVISMVPAAASNVYKEIGLKDVDLDIWYANAWVAFYQLIWGVLTIWTVGIKAFNDPPVGWTGFPAYVEKAHTCFLGYPVELNGKELPCDTGMLNLFSIFIVFNLMYNQLMLYIFKEGSSVLFVVSSAVCLPLTDLLYMIPFLSGPKALQKFTIYDGFSLFVLVMGLLVYHSEKEGRKRGDSSVEKSPMYASPSLQRTHLMKRDRGRVIYKQSPMFGKGGSNQQRMVPARPKYGAINSITQANTTRNANVNSNNIP